MQAAAPMIYLAASFFFAAAFDAVKKLSFACFTAHPDVYIRQEHHEERSVNYWRTWSTLDLRPADAVYESGTGMPNNCHGTSNCAVVWREARQLLKVPRSMYIPFPRSRRAVGSETNGTLQFTRRREMGRRGTPGSPPEGLSMAVLLPAISWAPLMLHLGSRGKMKPTPGPRSAKGRGTSARRRHDRRVPARTRPSRPVRLAAVGRAEREAASPVERREKRIAQSDWHGLQSEIRPIACVRV